MENLGDKIPITIAGYRIEHELGRGGMSIVYLAVQESLQRRLAIKVMSPALTLDPAFKERFLREGRIVAQLNHPNIIIVYDINFMANRYFIAMEYVPGPTLAHRITQGLKLADSFYIVKRIARALDYAHRRGFVHRDIKPSNILFREDGEPVLADFGIAKAVESDTKLTKTGLTPGTPSYMSPEQIRGRELDGRSDIYSLGIVFYEMLIGELPYRGDSSVSAALMHLTEPVPKLPRHLVFLEPVIEGMLAKVPEERFENEQVFREAVDRAIATSRNPRILEEVTLGYDHDAGSERTKHRRKSAPNSRKSPQAATWARLKSARQGWRWTTGAGALALLAGGTTFLLSEQGLDPRTQRAVDHLLVMAEQQLNQGQFIAPRNYNAYDTYREILAIAPDYKPALEGLDRIGAHFEQLAQQQREAAKPDNALRLVEQGLEVVPKHKDLLALKKSVIQQIAAEQRQQRIAKWYEAAEQQLANSQLAAPPGRNAFETYQKILKVDPNNQKALSGLQAVAAGMRDLAEKEFQQERFDESLAQLELGLRLFPNHQEMQALRDAVLKKKEIQTLLARAKQQIADLKHIEPAGNNAHESYRKVLALDPNNEEALSGIQRLVSGFAERARKKLSEGSMAEALGLIEDGFSVSPEDEALRTLQQETNRAILKKQRVEKLLAEGEKQLERLQLIATGDSHSAYDSFQAVLKLDPRNESALAGLDRVNERLRQLALEQRKNGQFTEGLATIKQGLIAFPKDESLVTLEKELRHELEQQRQPQAQQREVAKLLARAEEQMGALRLTQPPGDNAFETLQWILAAEPDNTQARDGLQAIADRYERLARSQSEAGNPEDALAMVERGLQVDATHAGLLGLQETLGEALEESRRRNAELRALLGKAEQQLNGSRATEPPGDNAYETLQEVLSRDPQNSRARAGLRAIAMGFETSARALWETGNLEEGIASVEKGLQLFPENRNLVALQQALSRNLEIKPLLAKAGQQLDTQKWTQPAGDNAYETLQKVLGLDAKNTQAKALLRSIPERCEKVVLAKQQAGNLQEGVALVQETLRYFPDEPKLLQLLQELKATPSAEPDPLPESNSPPTRARQEQDKPHVRPFGTF